MKDKGKGPVEETANRKTGSISQSHKSNAQSEENRIDWVLSKGLAHL